MAVVSGRQPESRHGESEAPVPASLCDVCLWGDAEPVDLVAGVIGWHGLVFGLRGHRPRI